MDLISVIVPVYKVEQYLDKCVESIVNQTYKNLEIILVDDGSPDSCPQMCDEWARKDSRIKVLHKENGGLSDARNAGIAIATGQYIAFVDSDDWIDKCMYENFMQCIEATGSDIVCCGIMRVVDDEKVEHSRRFKGAGESFSAQEAIRELILNRKIQQVVWNKLYRKDLLRGILFECGKTNEDEFWTYQIVGNSKSVTVLDYEGYFYLQRAGSIMNEGYSLKRLDAIEAKVYRQHYIEQNFHELATVARKDLLYSCLYHGQLSMKYLKPESRDIAFRRLKKIVKTFYFRKEEMCNLRFKDKFWLRLGYRSLQITCMVRNFIRIGF